MDRTAALSVLVAALALLAGCGAFVPPTPSTDAPPPARGSPPATTATSSAPTSPSSPGGGDATPATGTTPTPDRLGWEGGYRYDDALPVNASDGLNATELDAVVARSMARVERLRGMEFEEPVPVSTISREEYRERLAGEDAGPARRAYENARFEALFLIGEGEDALAIRERTFGSVVAGFYTPAEDRIVLVSEGETPTISETVLGHELVHALQYRRLDAGDLDASTTDGRNAVAGLIEGDARLVDARYADRCGEEWSCVRSTGFGAGGGARDFRFELYFLDYFPYSDGPAFVRHFHEAGGWERVNELYGAPPASGEQIIDPAKYGEDAPRTVRLPDRSARRWSVVAPAGRDATDTLGQPAIAAMFAHPTFDPRSGLIVPADRLIHTDPGTDRLRSIDPFEYGFGYADGWDGDRFRAYENRDGELAYVWRIAWDSREEAHEFAAGYRELLVHWGGERVNGSAARWRIPENESGFADAFSVLVDGDTVTVVNAPRVEALSSVYASASISVGSLRRPPVAIRDSAEARTGR